VVAPAATPQPVIAKLNGETNRILKMADVSERLTNQGAEVMGGAPGDFAEHIRREIPKWAKVIKDSGARAD
jgi:tripartite-type tricarboxylate transporter receptor subunit TctC